MWIVILNFDRSACLQLCYTIIVVIKIIFLIWRNTYTFYFLLPVDPCVDVHCVNGQCVPSDDFLKAICQCSPDYTGELCDTKCKLD